MAPTKNTHSRLCSENYRWQDAVLDRIMRDNVQAYREALYSFEDTFKWGYQLQECTTFTVAE